MSRLAATGFSAFLTLGSLAAQVSFHSVAAFGDSLIDNDVMIWAPKLAPLYGTDPIELLVAKVETSPKSLGSYAAGGSTIERIPSQFLRFLDDVAAKKRPDATLVSYTCGSNDFLFNLHRFLPGPPGKFKRADRLRNEIVDTIQGHVLACLQAKPKASVILWGIADLTKVPGWPLAITKEGKEHVRLHIEAANQRLSELGKDPRVLFFDLNQPMREVFATPPVILGHKLELPPAYGRQITLFADPVHPSSVANGILANSLIDAVNAKWSMKIPKYSDSELARFAGLDPKSLPSEPNPEGAVPAGR